jgi:hypothetical protein
MPPAEAPRKPTAPPAGGNLGPNIALAVLMLYAASLTVLTLDSIFRWGLFPTKLDRILRGHIAQLGSADAKAVRDARTELIKWHDLAVTQLIRALSDPNPAIRKNAYECLTSITGQTMAFGPDAPEAERAAQIAAWRKWWDQNGGVFR